MSLLCPGLDSSQQQHKAYTTELHAGNEIYQPEIFLSQESTQGTPSHPHLTRITKESSTLLTQNFQGNTDLSSISFFFPPGVHFPGVSPWDAPASGPENPFLSLGESSGNPNLSPTLGPGMLHCPPNSDSLSKLPGTQGCSERVVPSRPMACKTPVQGLGGDL